MSGSVGTSKGSLVSMTTDSESPGTSTPSQKDFVPSRTARSVALNEHPPAAGFGGLDDGFIEDLLIPILVWFGNVVRDIEQRRALIIIRRAELHLFRFIRAEGVA